jgi:predicted DNA-binding transcriptional regulator AlpA
MTHLLKDEIKHFIKEELRLYLKNNHDETLTLDQAVQLTGLSKSTIYIKCHLGQIPYFKSAGGGKNYFSKLELIGWMRGKRVESVDQLSENIANRLKTEGNLERVKKAS